MDSVNIILPWWGDAQSATICVSQLGRGFCFQIDVIYVEFKVFQEYFQVFLDSWTRIFRSFFANESLTLHWRSSLSLSVRLGRLLLSVTCGWAPGPCCWLLSVVTRPPTSQHLLPLLSCGFWWHVNLIITMVKTVLGERNLLQAHLNSSDHVKRCDSNSVWVGEDLFWGGWRQSEKLSRCTFLTSARMTSRLQLRWGKC